MTLLPGRAGRNISAQTMTFCLNTIDGKSTAEDCLNFRWPLELGFRQGQVSGTQICVNFVAIYRD